MKKRLLFFAEAVTLSHVARPAMLYEMLDKENYDLYFASDPRYDHLFPEIADKKKNIWSISSKRFLDALAMGRPVYSESDLLRYVKEDIALIEKIEPDHIIGDFRLSLSVSARITRTSYTAITNAYWSIFSDQYYPVPELPVLRFLNINVSQFLFDLGRPLAFSFHCTPLNRVRKRYGLPSLGHDLRKVYSDADEVLLADDKNLFPISRDAKNCHYIGPIYWSPKVSFPLWWQIVETKSDLIFVTLGSSGPIDLLSKIISVLAEFQITAIVATAGRIDIKDQPKNVFVSEYIPAEDAVKRSRLVICNGGSMMTYHAIKHGKPVLGIVSNLDQHLNMSYLEKSGIGNTLRSEMADIENIRLTIDRMLNDSNYKEKAEKAGDALNQFNSKELFPQYIKSLNQAHE